MSTDSTLPKLNLKEISSLIVLMAEAREITNTELKQIAGFALDGKERRTLVDLKLVEWRKIGRAYAHQLSEKGWATCRLLLQSPRPSGAGSAGGALFVLLSGIDRALAQAKMSPADFFKPPIDIEAPAVVAATAGDVESLIRAAYQRLAPEPGGWVGLAELRPALKQLSRPEIDDALRNMMSAPTVHLIPVANLASLSQADRDAALSVGGEENHALSIEGA
jgi:hypothetical protein